MTARKQVTKSVIKLLVDLFRKRESWHRSDIPEFLEAALPQIQAAADTIAQYSAQQITDKANRETNRSMSTPTVEVDVYNQRGKPAEEVYERPFVEVYDKLDKGYTLEDGVDAGANRLQELVEGDLQIAYREASNQTLNRLENKPTGWLRTLQGPENCALCVVASTQLYSRSDLNPIHPGCDCDVDPYYSERLPKSLDDRLEAVHDAVAALTGQSERGARGKITTDYRELFVSMLEEHGELGKVLAYPRQEFTSKSDI